MAEDKDIVTEEHDGGKFEFHQHGGGHKMMEGMMNKYTGNELLWPLIFGVGGYWIGKESNEGRRGRGHGGHGDDEGCCLVNKFELKQSEIIANKDAEIAFLKAKDFTLETNKCLEKEIGRLNKEVGELKVFIAGKVECLEKNDKDVLEDAIEYGKAHYLPGVLRLPEDVILKGCHKGKKEKED